MRDLMLHCVILTIMLSDLCGSDDYLLRKIPSIKFENASPKDAVTLILNAYQKEFPEDANLRGFIVEGKFNSEHSIALDLRSVPLGEALYYVAMSSSLMVKIRDGIVILSPSFGADDSDESFIVTRHMTDKMNGLISIDEESPSKSIKRSLSKLQIKEDWVTEASYDKHKKIIMLHVKKYAAKKVEAILDLASEGFILVNNSNNP